MTEDHESSSAAAGGRIRRVRFDERGVEAVAAALAADLGVAPFRLPSATVYQALVPGADERPATLLTFWPSIRRVDAINNVATVVFTGITGVEIVAGVEVVFRQDGRATLIVTVGGKIIVRV